MIKNPTDNMEDENTVLEKFEENIDFHNGRYTVKLPIRESHEVLGDNYFGSKNTVFSLISAPGVYLIYEPQPPALIRGRRL